MNELGLGEGAPLQQKVPSQIDASRVYRSVAAGQFSTCALDSQSHLYCWGSNAYGQSLLDGVSASQPVQVSDRTDIVEVQSNAFHTCFLTQAQEIFCLGLNEWGEFGLGDQLPRNEPTRIGGSAAVLRFVVSWQHTCLEQAGFGLRCSGRSLEGQIGDGSTGIVTEFRPTQFP